MPSTIEPDAIRTEPMIGSFALDVRENFLRAATDIEALQARTVNPVTGTLAAPAFGLSAGSDTYGFYRTAPGAVGQALNGVLVSRTFTNRILFNVSIGSDVDGGALLGNSATNRFQGLGLSPRAAPNATPFAGLIQMSDGTSATAGFGATGAGLYRYEGAAWVKIG